MREVDQSAASAATVPPPRLSQTRGSINPGFGRVGLGAAAGLALALLLGIQLGALHWRFRKEIWQAQGAIMGLVAGFAIGRLCGSRSAPSSSREERS
ncbi:MAG: hypothetical protein ACK46L_17285 [Synechococcaceae cyanobacterium]